MEKIIKLHSTGEAHIYLKMIRKSDNKESKTYVLKTDIPTLKMGYINEKHKFVNPLDGPMIVEGEYLKEANAVVKSLDYVEGYGQTITFE